MKKFFALLLVMGFSLMAHAEGKIAVVNFEEAIFNTDIAQQKIQEMENDAGYKANMETAKKIQQEGKVLTDQYKKDGPIMSAEQKHAMEAKLKEKQADLEHVGRKIQETKKKVLAAVMYSLRLPAMKAAKEIVEAEGIGLLLNASPETVYHSDTSFDITAKVTEKLNKLQATLPKSKPLKK